MTETEKRAYGDRALTSSYQAPSHEVDGGDVVGVEGVAETEGEGEGGGAEEVGVGVGGED